MGRIFELLFILVILLACIIVVDSMPSRAETQANIHKFLTNK